MFANGVESVRGVILVRGRRRQVYINSDALLVSGLARDLGEKKK